MNSRIGSARSFLLVEHSNYKVLSVTDIQELLDKSKHTDQGPVIPPIHLHNAHGVSTSRKGSKAKQTAPARRILPRITLKKARNGYFQ